MFIVFFIFGLGIATGILLFMIIDRVRSVFGVMIVDENNHLMNMALENCDMSEIVDKKNYVVLKIKRGDLSDTTYVSDNM